MGSTAIHILQHNKHGTSIITNVASRQETGVQDAGIPGATRIREWRCGAEHEYVPATTPAVRAFGAAPAHWFIRDSRFHKTCVPQSSAALRSPHAILW